MQVPCPHPEDATHVDDTLYISLLYTSSDKHRSGMQKEDMAGQSCRSSSLVPTQSGNRPTGEAQETETETVKDKRHEQERM